MIHLPEVASTVEQDAKYTKHTIVGNLSVFFQSIMIFHVDLLPLRGGHEMTFAFVGLARAPVSPTLVQRC